MTRKLYDENSFLKEFYATVLECTEYNENWAVVLDQTAFFPEGGGQPSDIGFLDNSRVLDVQIADDKIYHITNQPLAVGSTVTGTISFERRFDFMQQHSAEHIVSGIAHSLFGCENVGFHLSEEIVTLDFDKPLNRDQITVIEERANRKVFENVGFRCYYPADSELETLEYRSKKELEGAIRIVEIEGTDICACCAPHVKTAGEIGLIKLLDSERLRGGVRLQLKAGLRALKDYNDKYHNIKKISSLLATAQNETAAGVEKLLQSISELKGEITQLKLKELQSKVASFIPEGDKTAVFEDGLSVKDLQSYSDAIFKSHGGIRAAFSKTEAGFAFAICGNEGLDDFFKAFKEAFNVKGGGRNGMVQGNVTATKEEIEAFFN